MLPFTEKIFIKYDHVLETVFTRNTDLHTPSAGRRHMHKGRGPGGLCAGTEVGPAHSRRDQSKRQTKDKLNILDM